jgi:L-fuconate dehydratase
MRSAIDVVQIDACRLGGVNEVLAVLLMAAKYDLPVCPHAGGVGLCEYVQHLAMIDYLAFAGTMEGRVVEYVDHLHEHFVHPCVVRNGAYLAPEAPGYSIEMKPSSLAAFEWRGKREAASRNFLSRKSACEGIPFSSS